MSPRDGSGVSTRAPGAPPPAERPAVRQGRAPRTRNAHGDRRRRTTKHREPKGTVRPTPWIHPCPQGPTPRHGTDTSAPAVDRYPHTRGYTDLYPKADRGHLSPSHSGPHGPQPCPTGSIGCVRPAENMRRKSYHAPTPQRQWPWSDHRGIPSAARSNPSDRALGPLLGHPGPFQPHERLTSPIRGADTDLDRPLMGRVKPPRPHCSTPRVRQWAPVPVWGVGRPPVCE